LKECFINNLTTESHKSVPLLLVPQISAIKSVAEYHECQYRLTTYVLACVTLCSI